MRCLPDFHEMGVVPRKTMYPPVDFRSSILPAQSTSVKPWRDKKESRVRWRPKEDGPFKYRRIRLTATQWPSVGACKKLTYLVHNITDVWSSKGEILKSTNNLVETSGIRKQVSRLYIKFGNRSWCINMFTR